jgi:hypothetical protein
MNTAMMQLYEMLDEGKVSDIAEIKEYFLVLEERQIKDAYLNGWINSYPTKDSSDYYKETYGKYE